MKVSFFRKILFEAEVEMTLRLFSFSAGWSHPIDPETGMSVSLAEVDGWIRGATDLAGTRSWKSLESLLRFMQSEGLNPSRKSPAVLERVEIADDYTHEKISWSDGEIRFHRILQIQGQLRKKLRVLQVEISGPSEFLDPEEMFQFEAESLFEVSESLRLLLRLRKEQNLVVSDPLLGLSWS